MSFGLVFLHSRHLEILDENKLEYSWHLTEFYKGNNSFKHGRQQRALVLEIGIQIGVL